MVVKRMSVQREGGVRFELEECVSLVCPATRQLSTGERSGENILNSREEESPSIPYLSSAGPANKKTRYQNNIVCDKSISSSQNRDRGLDEVFRD